MTMPMAAFVFNKEKKKSLCEWTLNLKLPYGYAFDLSRCVDIQVNKLQGTKSHDYHIFMGRLLPITLRELLPTNTWKALIELSQFFRDLCYAQFDIDDDSFRAKNP